MSRLRPYGLRVTCRGLDREERVVVGCALRGARMLAHGIQSTKGMTSNGLNWGRFIEFSTQEKRKAFKRVLRRVLLPEILGKIIIVKTRHTSVARSNLS